MMRSLKNFKVNRSSAGSGKTYTLSLNFIALSLVGADRFSTDYYKKILAITFTNKAAAEMKERVLEYLEVLSNQSDKDSIQSWIIENTNLSEKKIYELSEKVRTHILHNYADLRISTIDKFIYNIVRTFASDLGLSYDFELEMDNYKIIQPVVATLLSKISNRGGPLSESLVNFALQKSQEGKSSNIQSDLENFCEHLFKEQAIPFISSNNISIPDCILVKNNLYKKRRKIINDIKKLSDSAVIFFNKLGFTKNHFLRGTFYNHFTINLQSSSDNKWTPSDKLIDNINSNVWYAKQSSDDIKQLVDTYTSDLIDLYDNLMILLKEYNTAQALLSNIYSIAVLNELLLEINTYKRDQNIEQISVFNKRINDVIVKQPSSFIYERIGERYSHFLIDEFQDTSLLQWQNMLPLITDAIDCGTSLIVGDGKQSIYRWRGGEVEQFIEMPKIFQGEELLYKKEWESKLDIHYVEDKHENQNYRSRKEIIKFNNVFFDFVKTRLSSNLQKIYDKCSQKFDRAIDGGYVHLELVKDDKEGFKENIILKIIKEIRTLKLKNKFQNKDICILCNSRKRVALVAERLSEVGINVISNQGLLLNSSDKIRVVIATMYFLLDKQDILSKTIIMNFLQNRCPLSMNMNKINLQLHSDDSFNNLLDDFNIKLISEELLCLSLYDIVENLYKILDISEDVYTSFFLDTILNFIKKNGSNLPEFLEWWEEKKESDTIVVPEGTDAVQVMTIHQSKGLAFSVVMIPFNWEGGKTYNEIWVDSSSYTSNKLKSALIRSSRKLDISYFSNENIRENELSFMDNLNKLYVAMTRPIDRLYIFAKEYPDKKDENFQKSGKLNSFLYMYGVMDKLIQGDPSEGHISEDDNLDTYHCTHFNKIDWRSIISLKKSSEKSWDIQTNNTKKDWGKLLHLALSRIQYKTDVPDITQNIFLEGLCDVVQKKRLDNEISRLLNHKYMIEFFEEKWEVKNETEILMKTGDSYIPDRILFSETRTVVIDYKTGKPREVHKDQIINYASILEIMGYNNVEKYLVYTNEDSLVHKI